MWDIFGDAKISNAFRVLEISNIFLGGWGGGGERQMLKPSLRMKKMRVSAPCGQRQVHWINGANLH